jgi:SpoVK/Ycf46/Vps4 family AAA+-type ATPase
MAGEDGQVVGIGGGDQRHHQTLGDMVSTPQYAPSVGQADWAQAPVNATETRRVLALGLRLFRFDGRPVAVLQRRMSRMHGNGQGVLEVLCPDADVANALIERATALATEHSVLRGNVISLEMQGFEAEGDGYRFLPRPDVAADQVILPDGVLDRITGHVTGIARHAEVLRRHGQHLKRGVLLYGPPGTGKTHTVRHLIGAATGHTVILLSGETLALIGPATAIARHLQPAIVVLEDCDLVAMERDYMGGMRPLLFQLLDALDGLDADADISFLLTTNRVDVLEEALTQRPGRVDLAVEIPPPGPRERRRLLELYRGDIGYSDAVLHEVAGRSDAHTASFFKELMRRAVLLAAEEGEEPADQHLLGALASLQADQDRLSHSLLGGLGGDLDGFVE